MRRVIVDYAKLTSDILDLLVEKFPDGYDDSDIISFRNAQNELVEAVEVRTDDTIYLVKVSTKLATRMEKYEEEDDDEIVDELDAVIEPIPPVKGMDIDDDDLPSDDDDEEIDLLKDKGGSDDGDEDDDDDDDFSESDNFDDDDDEE